MSHSPALLRRGACPRCRGALVPIGGTVVCDTCDYEAPRAGQPTAAATPPRVVEPRPRYRDYDRRRDEAVAWLRAHPWSTPVEAAKALHCSDSTLREIFLDAGAERRQRPNRGRGRVFEYAMPEAQEVVAC